MFPVSLHCDYLRNQKCPQKSQQHPHLEFLVCARGFLAHHFGASDVAELVGVAVQEQEGPGDGWDLPLDARRRPHQLHAERHPHPAVEVQLVSIIRLYLVRERERKEKGDRKKRGSREKRG